MAMAAPDGSGRDREGEPAQNIIRAVAIGREGEAQGDDDGGDAEDHDQQDGAPLDQVVVVRVKECYGRSRHDDRPGRHRHGAEGLAANRHQDAERRGGASDDAADLKDLGERHQHPEKVDPPHRPEFRRHLVVAGQRRLPGRDRPARQFDLHRDFDQRAENDHPEQGEPRLSAQRGRRDQLARADNGSAEDQPRPEMLQAVFPTNRRLLDAFGGQVVWIFVVNRIGFRCYGIGAHWFLFPPMTAFPTFDRGDGNAPRRELIRRVGECYASARKPLAPRPAMAVSGDHGDCQSDGPYDALFHRCAEGRLMTVQEAVFKRQQLALRLRYAFDMRPKRANLVLELRYRISGNRCSEIISRLISGFGVMTDCHATRAAMRAPRRAFPAVGVCCGRTGKSQDRSVISPARCRGAGAARSEGRPEAIG